jgi:hypothetical protein
VGLDKLGSLATQHVYVDGTLYTKDVGQALPDSFRLLHSLSRSMYIQGSIQMGTFFNDIQPRNMGASGIIFDPAIDPVTKTIFWGGVLGIGAGTGYYTRDIWSLPAPQSTPSGGIGDKLRKRENCQG